MKKNADKTNHAQPTKIKTVDEVLIKQNKCNKSTIPFGPKPYRVIRIKGQMLTAERQSYRIIRSSSHFKRPSNDRTENEYPDSDYDDLIKDLPNPRLEVEDDAL